MEKDFNKEKAKKSFENITGLPVTSDESSGTERIFTSTVYSDKPLWGGKGTSEKKAISSEFGSEKKYRDEELKRKKEEEEISKERSRRKKNWKTYTHSERWDEEDIGVEVQTTATGDFEVNRSENSSAEITELTEEEANKLENEGIEKVSDKEKNGENHSSHYSEVSHKSRNKWDNKTPFVIGGLSFLGLISVVALAVKS